VINYLKKEVIKMEVEERIKNSLQIDFRDFNGNKHLYYNEETPSE